MKKIILLTFLMSYNLCAMEQPNKKQKVENFTNPFAQLPEEIILHIFCYAMPVLQNKEVCKNKDWENKIVLHMPEEFFSQNFITYKNVSESCKQFNQLLKDDEGIFNLMKYLKQRKKFLDHMLLE